MPDERVNYDTIAPAYHHRYAVNSLRGVATELHSLVQKCKAEAILEVGCGTGRWLAELRADARLVCGLDLSPGMLRQAREHLPEAPLVCGRANQLPFAEAAFDLVFCVNAIHHFDQPQVFIAEARRLLRPGGALAVICMDPHTGRDRWYLYDYFEGTREADLRRFPSGGMVLDWMTAAGFHSVEWQAAERIRNRLMGREVLDSHFLQKHGTSQLALLTDAAYTAGLSKIKAALAEAEAVGTTLVFPVDIWLTMLTGWAPGE